MNNPNQQANEPEIATAQPGGIEDSIMGGTPNQIEIDKDFSEKINNAVDNSQGESGNPEGVPKDVAASEPNSDTYEPAKEFTDFLNKEVAAGEQRGQPTDTKGAEAPNTQPDLSVLQSLLADNPHMAPAVKEALAAKGINLDAPGDPATIQRLDGMQSDINQLVQMISGDRNTVIQNEAFNNINDVYMDVVKETPDYQRSLTDFFNNALLRDYDLGNIDREILEGSNKAISSELDNYYQARLKAEGKVVPKNNLPSTRSRNGELTPPPASEKTASSMDPNNRPANAFDEVDKDFAQKVNNLFSQ